MSCQCSCGVAQMTFPIAFCFVSICAVAGFCFWARLKHKEAERLDIHSAAVEQLARHVDSLEAETQNLTGKCARTAIRVEELDAMARDIARLDSQSAKRDSVSELSDRVGRLELEQGMRLPT